MGMCDLCDKPIRNDHEATRRRGKWIHKVCAPGGDDA